MSEERDPKRLMAEALKVLQSTQARLHALEAAQHEPIAIIGAGCRLPNQVNDRLRLWEALFNGEDFMGPVPRDRWDTEHFYDADPSTPGRMVMHTGGFIEAPEAFDAQAFGMSPREAVHVDPQQRVLLEVTWEAIEDAQIRAKDLQGKSVGVFMGISTVDYVSHLVEHLPRDQVSAFQGTGISHSSASGRISFALGLTGPSLALNTACSSSLVAIHLACESLRRGECEAALVGGVNLILQPFSSVVFSQARMLAKDGRCKPFSAQADGYGRSEGAAVLVLKPLRRALADGDQILAEIVGSAVNQDGASGGLTVPNGPMQEAVIAQALKAARIAPEDVGHIEAHGTGTSLGDPLEMRALGQVFGRSHSSQRPLSVSSIKSNLGHLEAAAGVAGILKVALELKHQMLVPHLHAQDRSPHIPWAELPVTIPQEPIEWNDRLHAGVSSFGFTGTNVHVVLRAASASAKASSRPVPRPTTAAVTEASSVALCWSAHSKAALRAYAASLAQRIEQLTEEDSLAAIASALAHGRTPLSERASLVAAKPADAAQQLRAFALGENQGSVSAATTRPRIDDRRIFVLTDDGADPWQRWESERKHSVFAQQLETTLHSAAQRPNQEDPSSVRRLLLLTLAERATANFGAPAKIAIHPAASESASQELEAVRDALSGKIAISDLLRCGGGTQELAFPCAPFPTSVNALDSESDLTTIEIGYSTAPSLEESTASIRALNPALTPTAAHATQAADAHCSGLDIRRCFEPAADSRIDLPRYPWQHQHYFVQPNPAVAHANGSSDHPLLGDLQESQDAGNFWTARWRAGGHPPHWMSMVSNRGFKVLPEGALVEILLETARRMTKSDSFVCSNIHLRPQAWHPSLELEVNVTWQWSSELSIEILARTDTPQWRSICEATVAPASDPLSFQALSTEASDTTHDPSQIWELEDRAGLLVEEPGRALVAATGLRRQRQWGDLSLRLSDTWDLESASYSLHPLLWQSMMAGLGAYEGIQGLSALHIGSLAWSGCMGRAARMQFEAPYLCMKPVLLCFGENGDPVAKISGLRVAASSELWTPFGAHHGPALSSLQTIWEPSFFGRPSAQGTPESYKAKGRYLVITAPGEHELTTQISLLVAAGFDLRICSLDELEEAPRAGLAGILDLRHRRRAPEPGDMARALEREISTGIQLARYASRHGLPWILVTSSAVNYSGQSPINPVFASVAAFHRSWMREESALASCHIDFLDSESDLAGPLAAAISQVPHEREFRVKNGALSVPRWTLSERHHLQDEAEEFSAHGRNWLVTGGRGALGLAIAEGLAAAGAQSILLVSRSGAKEAQHQTLKRLSKLYSTSFMVRLVDVTLEDSVESLARDLKAEDIELYGIVHAAGVLDDQLVEHLDAESLRNVLGPKVEGTLSLRRNFPEANLVIFTSMSALLGNPGQAAYAAANAFADAYADVAHRARNRFKSPWITSIRWGPWAGHGMASGVSERAKAAMNQRGVLHLDPRDAVNWFIRSLRENRGLGGTVAAIDLERYRSSIPAMGEVPRLRRLAGPSSVMAAPSTNRAKAQRLSETLAACTPEDGGAFLLDAMRTAIASILRVAPDDLNAEAPVIDLGLDSLMGVELRNRVRAELDLDLPLAPLLQGASLKDVSQLLVEQMAEAERLRREEEDLIEEIEGLTPEEVERLLRDDG